MFLHLSGALLGFIGVRGNRRMYGFLLIWDHQE